MVIITTIALIRSTNSISHSSGIVKRGSGSSITSSLLVGTREEAEEPIYCAADRICRRQDGGVVVIIIIIMTIRCICVGIIRDTNRSNNISISGTSNASINSIINRYINRCVSGNAKMTSLFVIGF